ncbi:CRISPR-associated endoribonuclease Cas6 [Stygiolobus caldivivus]|uniref:Uncharacterized protein n=1 Tax=Stygiolobus caldivivus TaxID=2824673 RepID=A0A8D5ZHZ1_9CREN|nr:CRISPR-associated endoribonuclease Cas6 [Stygiolobus caldivivus]BCU70139.1 hypothetical protein KN1_14360 [Stygiolobus caldivivus]
MTYLLAEVVVTPTTSAIIPPFTSKVGKSLVLSRKVTISPLRVGNTYLVRYSTVPYFMEVEAGKEYSFDVGGDYYDVIDALKGLERKKVFNTVWEVVDVKLREVEFEFKDKIKVSVRTPALIADPLKKSKKKRFTNLFAFVFAVNFMDHLGLTREEFRGLILEVEGKVREEPSKVWYETVIYAGKKVVGLVGELRYTLLEEDERVKGALENAIAKGIGSSRRNGFGRVTVESE